MAIHKTEDIRGYWVDEKLLCPGCYEKTDKETKAKGIVTEKDLEENDSIGFCDECEKEL